MIDIFKEDWFECETNELNTEMVVTVDDAVEKVKEFTCAFSEWMDINAIRVDKHKWRLLPWGTVERTTEEILEYFVTAVYKKS